MVAFAFVYPQNLRETSRPLMLLNCVAFTAQVLGFHIGLACLVAAILALALRRWRLLGLSLAVAIVTLAPDLWSYRTKSPPPPAGDTLRIASVNIFAINHSPRYMLPELSRIDADILLVQEWNDWHEGYLTPLITAQYPHQLRFAHSGTRGMAIFSKIPFEETTPPGVDVRLSPQGMRFQRIVVEHEGRGLAIYNVHPVSPARLGAIVWGQRQIAELLDAVANEDQPYILAGDFNAATHTSNLDAIQDLGLTEAHGLAGRGRGTTWPSRTWKRRLPGVRIDHIFLSDELTATSADVGRYHGSDHLSVFADVGWRAGS